MMAGTSASFGDKLKKHHGLTLFHFSQKSLPLFSFLISFNFFSLDEISSYLSITRAKNFVSVELASSSVIGIPFKFN